MAKTNTREGFSPLHQYEIDKWGAIFALEKDALEQIFNDIDGCLGKTPTGVELRETIAFLCPKWIDSSYHEKVARQYECTRVISMEVIHA